MVVWVENVTIVILLTSVSTCCLNFIFLIMRPRLVQWCAHPSRHKNGSKVGRTVTFPKGQRAIRERLAAYMCSRYRSTIGGTKRIVKPSDFLCTACYHFEHNRMLRRYSELQPAQHDTEENFDGNNDNGTLFSINSDEELFEEDNEELIDTSLSDSTEQKYSQIESLKILNSVFELLKIETVNDVYVLYKLL